MQKPMKAAQAMQTIISFVVRLLFISILPFLLGCTARAMHHDITNAIVYIRLIITICAGFTSDLLNELDLPQCLCAVITSLPAFDAIQKL
jgi:hypothetical protein